MGSAQTVSSRPRSYLLFRLVSYNIKKEWKFVTNKLGIAYTWGFPFKRLVDYKGWTVVLMTIQQAKEFLSELDKGDVEVRILNQEISGTGSERRGSVIYRIVEDSQN